MCAAKSPISELQELAMAKHMSLPYYDLTSQGSGFKCIGTVGHISAVTVAESKKRAKHLCAEELLASIQLNKGISKVVVEHHIVQQIQVEVQEVSFNAIGQLNELCSQNGQAYADYEHAGIQQQKFVVRCKLLSHITQGLGPTKKQAKQNAAKEMLSRITTEDFRSKKLKLVNTELDEQVIRLYKQLSVAKCQTPQFDSQIYDMFDVSNDKTNMQNIKVEQEIKKPPELNFTEEELRKELLKLGVVYHITEFQRSPLVLALKTTATIKHPRYTFLHSEGNYTDSVRGILQKALRDLRIMFK